MKNQANSVNRFDGPIRAGTHQIGSPENRLLDEPNRAVGSKVNYFLKLNLGSLQGARFRALLWPTAASVLDANNQFRPDHSTSYAYIWPNGQEWWEAPGSGNFCLHVEAQGAAHCTLEFETAGEDDATGHLVVLSDWQAIGIGG